MKDYSEFLKNQPLFSELNPNQLNIIKKLTKELTFDEEDIIINEGDESHEMFIIIDGEVEVLKQQETGEIYRLATLTTGAVIGEMSLLEDIPRTATIRALSKAHILSFSTSAFRDLRKANNIEEQITYYMLIEKMAHELSSRLRIANESLADFLHSNRLESDAIAAKQSLFTNLWF